MATPTTIDTDTELSAVNSILGAIGQSPVTSLGTIDEITGEVTYTGTGTNNAAGKEFDIVSSFTTSSEIKVTINGDPTTDFTISGSVVTFNTAPLNGAIIRIYRQKEIANTLANPEVSFIYNILTEVNKDVQNEGWICNIERHVKVSPDANKNIEIPANYLSYDLHDNLTNKTRDLVRRKKGGKYLLYDTVDHTYEFDNDLYLDIVYLWPFEDLPNVFKRYITYRAAVRAATQLVANPQLAQLLQSQEGMARAACIEYECNQGDHSFFGIPHESRYKSYQPFNSLRR